MAAPSITRNLLTDFIQQNHNQYGIRIHENLAHHNHTPHLLGSAFLLGANEVQLKELFEDSCRQTDHWTTAPTAITEKNFVDHLGKAEYQKAYVDFFSAYPGDWKDMASEYLFHGPLPLFNSLMSGLTHPMIHLAYAIELQSRELAIEALGLAATCHDFMHKYLKQERHAATPSPKHLSQLQILNKIHNDPRFDDVQVDTIQSMEPLFQASPDAFLEYWTTWSPDTQQQPLTQKLAVTLLAAPTANDFVFCHALTSYHAIQVIANEIPDKTIQANLNRQWWFWVIMAYVMQGRPLIRYESVEEYAIGSRDWTWVRAQALTGKWNKEHHVVKATRAILYAAESSQEESDKMFYLKAAVRFLDKFDGWTGFGKDLPSFERHVVRSM